MSFEELTERMVLKEIEKSINELPPETREKIKECASKMKQAMSDYDIDIAQYAATLVESQCRVALLSS